MEKLINKIEFENQTLEKINANAEGNSKETGNVAKQNSQFQYSLASERMPSPTTATSKSNQSRPNGALLYFGILLLVILLGIAGVYYYTNQSGIKADIRIERGN